MLVLHQQEWKEFNHKYKSFYIVYDIVSLLKKQIRSSNVFSDLAYFEAFYTRGNRVLNDDFIMDEASGRYLYLDFEDIAEGGFPFFVKSILESSVNVEFKNILQNKYTVNIINNSYCIEMENNLIDIFEYNDIKLNWSWYVNNYCLFYNFLLLKSGINEHLFVDHSQNGLFVNYEVMAKNDIFRS